MLMSSAEYRESLRPLAARIFINGRRVENIADDPDLAPGINAIGITYDYARDARYRELALARQHSSGATVNRLLHIGRSGDDLLAKLELVRLLCQETGCAMRYLSGDGFNALFQATHRIDADTGTDYHAAT